MFDVFKSVTRHFFVYGVGGILNRVVGFALIPFYTHYLTPGDYGTLELIQLTVYMVGTFLGAGLTHAVMRFYYESAEQGRTVVSTALVSVLFVCITLGGSLALLSPYLSQLVFESRDYGGLLQLAVISLSITVVNETPLVFIRVQQKSALYTIISVIKLVLHLSLNILFIAKFGWGVRGIIVGGLITEAVTGSFLSVYTLKQVGWSFSRAKFKDMLMYGMPYIPGGFVMSILLVSDRFILQRFTDLREVGLYALGYKFGVVMSALVTQPFLLVWRPKRFEIAGRPDAKEIYGRMLTYFLYVELFLALGISVGIKDVIRIMADPKYHSAYQVVPIIVLAYVTLGAYHHVQIGILLEKKTKYILYIQMVAAAVAVGLNLVLVPIMGAWGAALATFSAFAVLTSLAYAVSQRFLWVHYEFARIGKMLLAAVVLYGLGLQIDVSTNIYVNLAVRLSIALMFPFVLILIGFYQPAEVRKIRDISRSMWSMLLMRLGLSRD